MLQYLWWYWCLIGEDKFNVASRLLVSVDVCRKTETMASLEVK